MGSDNSDASSQANRANLIVMSVIGEINLSKPAAMSQRGQTYEF